MHEYACFSSWASSCECSVVDSCEKVNRMFVVSHVWLSLSEVWSRERCECIKKIVVMCKIANIVYRIRKFFYPKIVILPAGQDKRFLSLINAFHLFRTASKISQEYSTAYITNSIP